MSVRFGRWTLGKGWTVPRAHALAVLADCPNGARVSNATEYRTPPHAPRPRPGSVYWQTAAWLQREGWARAGYAPHSIELTATGRELVRQLGPRA